MTYLEWKENYRLERIKKNEIWKDVPNYEGLYQISNLGNVKSVDRFIVKSNGINQFVPFKMLNKEVNKNGYLRVTLCNNGLKKHFYIHLLVAYAFLEHTPSKHKFVVDHIYGNIKNNCVENLQLISQRKNTSKDRYKYGYSSNLIGVYWHKASNKWAATINANRKTKHLGLFKTELEASEAYQKALQLHNQETIT